MEDSKADGKSMQLIYIISWIWRIYAICGSYALINQFFSDSWGVIQDLQWPHHYVHIKNTWTQNSAVEQQPDFLHIWLLQIKSS